MAIKWIIFDAMGVVFQAGDDVKDLLYPHIKSYGCRCTFEEVDEIYSKAMVGEIGAVDFWKALGLDGKLPEIEDSYIKERFTPDKEFVELIKRLKGKYKIGMLSNDIASWSKSLRLNYDIDHFFDKVIISGELAMKKPELPIYKKMLEITGALPEECIFLDDKMHNLRPAKELGIGVIKVNRKGQPSFTPKGFEGMDSIESLLELLNILEEKQ